MIQERDAKISSLETKSTPAVTQPKPAIPDLSLTDDDADNSLTSAKATNAGFGTSFPSNPQKGDLFLRVDTMPNKLYKWNGQKWIEIAKSTTDRYAYEEEYIQYLLQKIRTREYTMDDLSQAERDQVINRMTYQEKSKL